MGITLLWEKETKADSRLIPSLQKYYIHDKVLEKKTEHSPGVFIKGFCDITPGSKPATSPK